MARSDLMPDRAEEREILTGQAVADDKGEGPPVQCAYRLPAVSIMRGLAASGTTTARSSSSG
jgi:hypothetical protein